MITSSLLLGPRPAAGGQTKLFAHRDAEYLWPGQHRGGLAFVPDTVDPSVSVPLVVFLHGVNGSGTLHNWFGGGGRDLREDIEALAREMATAFVVAAPSHTRGASMGSSLWRDFDAGKLVRDTIRAVEGIARIDETEVYIVGHSGAGCNLEGGVLTAALVGQDFYPRGLLAIDPCLDEEAALLLSRRWPETRLWVTWQAETWKRAPEVFREVLERTQPANAWFRMDQIETDQPDPHNALVMISLRPMIDHWIADESGSAENSGPAGA